MTLFLSTLLLLLFGHALADYPLQGDFLSRAKNRHISISGGVPWYQALAGHAFIHAGFVYLFTNSLILAALEFVAHAVIDDRKCAGKLTFNEDQLCHVACKIIWAAIAVWAL